MPSDQVPNVSVKCDELLNLQLFTEMEVNSTLLITVNQSARAESTTHLCGTY